MEQLSSEKKLTFAYAFCVIAGATASITNGIAWSHWYETLDRCGGTVLRSNCSCILYGEHTPSKFMGGGQAPCIWVTFGPLVYVFFALCFVCFHGYRIMFATKSPRSRTTRSVMTKLEPGDSVRIQAISQEDTSPLPKGFWIFKSVFSLFFFLYSLIHFSIFVDGYLQTCNEYRKSLEKILGLHGGSALPVIYNRLHCQSVFDFMDYLMLDDVNAYRNGIINTGLDLTIGVVMACFAWVTFLIAGFINIRLARAKGNEENEDD